MPDARLDGLRCDGLVADVQVAGPEGRLAQKTADSMGQGARSNKANLSRLADILLEVSGLSARWALRRI